jgi:hypothetical protein
MTEFVCIPRKFISLLPTLSPEAVAVYLFLIDRGYMQSGLGVGLSGAELARSSGVSYGKVSKILGELETNELLVVRDKGKAQEIVVEADEVYTIPYTPKNTDETKLAVLEAEVRRLRITNERQLSKTSSGIADFAQGEERDLYVSIEKQRGYALSASEALLLGKCVQKFGPERTKQTYQQMRRAKNPIVAAYAALQNGIKGGGAKQVESEPFAKITYRSLD